MPNTREKKSYLIDPREILFGLIVDAYQSDKTRENTLSQLKHIADHLIANGVTIQDDHHWATEQAYKNGYADGQPKWISVKERLPEDSCRVLIRSASGYIGTELYNKGRGQFECCGVWIPVTHWMPLPEPPKGE